MGKKPNKSSNNNTDNDDSNFDILPDDFTISSILSPAGSTDDLQSDEAEDVTVDGAVDRLSKLSDAIVEVEEFSSSKSKQAREKNLKLLYKALTQYATTYEARNRVDASMESLVNGCLFSLVKSSQSVERYVACRCLEAMAVVLGGNRDDYIDLVVESLMRVIKTTVGADGVVRGSALRALSMSCFICSSDFTFTTTTIELCEELAAETYRDEPNDLSLRTAALECWALLSTTMDESVLVEDDVGRGVMFLPSLLDCLYETKLELRCASGICVALIHEAKVNLGISEDQGQNITQRKYQQGTWDDTSMEEVMYEIQQQIADLSVQSGHKLSKKNKKEQRSIFREIASTVIDDEPPVTTVAFRGGSLNLSSWVEVIQLNFVRHCLQGGFQVSLLTNPTLAEIFDADVNVLREASNMNQFEKKLMSASLEKARDKGRIRRQTSRTRAKNHFITVDGEDI